MKPMNKYYYVINFVNKNFICAFFKISEKGYVVHSQLILISAATFLYDVLVLML